MENTKVINWDIVNVAKTPINVKVLEKYVSCYRHKDSAILLKGFKSGFAINYDGPRKSRDSKNLKSASQNPDIVMGKINKEISAGRMAGPFLVKPFVNLIVSPVGLVPKKTPGDFRLIHHFSFPEGESVNDYIDRKVCSVK